MCNSSGGRLFQFCCVFFWLLELLLLFKCFPLRFRQTVSRLTPLCETKRAAASNPLPDTDNVIWSGLRKLHRFQEYALVLSLSPFSLTVLDPTNSFASVCCSKQWLWCFIYKGRLPVNSLSSLTLLHFGGSADCRGRFGRRACRIFSPAPPKKKQHVTGDNF